MLPARLPPSGKRPQSFIEDEEIEIKPSTELIPDEYERKNNENMLVELFCRKIDEESGDLAKQLETLGFSVNKTIIDPKNINENLINSLVTGVNDKTKQKNYDGLIMIFAKVPIKNEVLKTIWGNFTSTKCPELKNKPKIFIFQISRKGLQVDSAQVPPQPDLTTAYNTPSEADMLIVYDKISSESSFNFLDNFHEHIKEYGRQEDIINLASISVGSESRPLIISTMTRKFFFTIDQYRGHHHNINENHTEIKENLEKIMNFIKNSNDHKPKDKEKSLMNSFRKTFNSFRNKNYGKESDNSDSEESRKCTEVKEDKSVQLVEVKEEKPVAGSSKEKPQRLKAPTEPIMVSPNKSPTKKTPNSNIPSTPTRKGSIQRSKYPSGSFSSKEDLSKKPPWK